MLNLVTDELSRRVNRFHTDQERLTSQLQRRVEQLEVEVNQLHSRAAAMTRLLISKNLLTAEKIASAMTEASELFPEQPEFERSETD